MIEGVLEGKDMKKYYKSIILFICLIGILAIIIDLWQQEIGEKDMLIYNLVSTYLISDFSLPIVKCITNLGSATFIIIMSTILLLVIENKLIGFFTFLNLVISGGLNQILKLIVQRPRPVGYRLIEESGYSFPSGHSMVSAAFYGFLIYLIYKNVKNKYIKYTLIVSLILLIVSIGISRIYLGVHYASDVLAGFLISICYLIIFTSIIKNKLFNNRPN